MSMNDLRPGNQATGELTVKQKGLLLLQRVLTKALTLTINRGVPLPEQDVAPLMARLVNGRSALATSLATQLAESHSNGSVQVISNLLGDTQNLPSPPMDIDKLINFSAYWRDEWVAKMAAQVPAGARVLDAGAGQCRYKGLFKHTEYRAQDFAQYEGSGEGPLQETWNYGAIDYVCDITDIPVETGSFDVVLCTEVLEHVPDPVAALRELVRVTAPGGKLLLTAPLGSGVHQEPYHFYGGFSAYFYERHLGNFGCDEIKAAPLGGLLRHVAQEIHRVGRALEQSKEGMTPERSYLMMDWLPRLLSEMEDNCFIEQFTVGYLVEARKRVPGAQAVAA